MAASRGFRVSRIPVACPLTFAPPIYTWPSTAEQLGLPPGDGLSFVLTDPHHATTLKRIDGQWYHLDSEHDEGPVRLNNVAWLAGLPMYDNTYVVGTFADLPPNNSIVFDDLTEETPESSPAPVVGPDALPSTSAATVPAMISPPAPSTSPVDPMLSPGRGAPAPRVARVNDDSNRAPPPHTAPLPTVQWTPPPSYTAPAPTVTSPPYEEGQVPLLDAAPPAPSAQGTSLPSTNSSTSLGALTPSGGPDTRTWGARWLPTDVESPVGPRTWNSRRDEALAACKHLPIDAVPWSNRKGAPLAALILKYHLDNDGAPISNCDAAEDIHAEYAYDASSVGELLAQIHKDGLDCILSRQDEAAASAVAHGASNLADVQKATVHILIKFTPRQRINIT